MSIRQSWGFQVIRRGIQYSTSSAIYGCYSSPLSFAGIDLRIMCKSLASVACSIFLETQSLYIELHSLDQVRIHTRTGYKMRDSNEA